MAVDSAKWTERLREIMPWGSSTCSKTPKYLPDEPGVIVRGRGCRVWDADGREFIDFRNALGPVTLGYGYPAVDQAIRRQLDDGIIFGHPHPLECEVAEQFCRMVPWASRARFLKTGGEAVAACMRLARFHTGREHIVQIGYNGWLSSLATGGRVLPGRTAASAPPGVPEGLAGLHHSCPWADAEHLERLLSETPGGVAAVVIAADYRDMPAGETFLPAAWEFTRAAGSVLIFDEIVTGFRVAIGGVGEHFGVTPDLAVFAKGIANGMPLSVYAGKAEIMADFQTVVVSSTMGGETLSLAAAKAAMETYRDQDVIGHLWRQGERMGSGLDTIFQRHGVPARMRGLWPCPAIVFDPDCPDDLPERFFRQAYRGGVCLYDVCYVNFSHQDEDIDEALDRLDAACGRL